MVNELPPESLRKECDASVMRCKTTQELVPLREIIGQERAVRAGRFHIYSVKTIDEGIEVLTGIKAGERQQDGTFESETVNYRVDKQLKDMAEKLKEFPLIPAEGKKKGES